MDPGNGLTISTGPQHAEGFTRGGLSALLSCIPRARKNQYNQDLGTSMLIDNRFELDESIPPVALGNSLMYAGKDLSKEAEYSLCTIKIYNTSDLNPLVQRYIGSAWRRDSESLRRMARSTGPNSAFIKYIAGGIGSINGDPSQKTLFVVWESTRRSEADPFVMFTLADGLSQLKQRLAKERKTERFGVVFLRNIAHLLRGVIEMHRRGIVHRNLTPRTLIYRQDCDEPRVRIGHFEMSYAFTTELRRALHRPGSRESVTQFAPGNSDIYKSPSHYQYGNHDQHQDFFSVGMMIYEYLVEPGISLPTSDWNHTLPNGLVAPKWIVAGSTLKAGSTYDMAIHRQFLDHCVSMANRSTLDGTLKHALVGLLDEPRKDYRDIVRKLIDSLLHASHRESRPNFLGYRVSLSPTVYNSYFTPWAKQLTTQVITGDAQYRESARKYLNETCLKRAVLRVQLASATREEPVFYIKADHGYPVVLECVQDPGSKSDDSCVNLICHKFHYRDAPIRDVWGNLPAFWTELVFEDRRKITVSFPSDVPHEQSSYGDWQEVLDTVNLWATTEGGSDNPSMALLAAHDISRAQTSVIYSQGYAYGRFEVREKYFGQEQQETPIRALIIYYDPEADGERQKRLFPTLSGRPSFETFFAELSATMQEVNGRNMSLLARDPDTLEVRHHNFKAAGTLFEVLDAPPAVVLDLHDIQLQTVPERGVLYHTLNDQQFNAARVQDESIKRIRQRRNSLLTDELDHPTAQRISVNEYIPSGFTLDEQKRRLVLAISNSDPFFVLQGPPGTGKTHTILALLGAILSSDRHARILISSQGHEPLNSLVLKLDEFLHTSPDGPTFDPDYPPSILRLFSFSREFESTYADPKRAATLAKYSLDAQQEAFQDKTLARIDKRLLSSNGEDDYLQSVFERLRALIGKTVIQQEVRFYLAKHANVTLATCIGVGNWGFRGYTDGGFDWVIVEEAAKAHLPELLVPMTYGDRWLLVGDHEQLPPFNYGGLEVKFDGVKRRVEADAISRAAPDIRDCIDVMNNDLRKLLRGLFLQQQSTMIALVHAVSHEQQFRNDYQTAKEGDREATHRIGIEEFERQQSHWREMVAKGLVPDEDPEVADLLSDIEVQNSGGARPLGYLKIPALPKVYMIAALLEASDRIHLPPQLQFHGTVEQLHNIPITLYEGIRNLKNLNSFAGSRLVDPHTGVSATLDLLLDAKSALTRRKYVGFREFLSLDDFAGLFGALRNRVTDCERRIAEARPHIEKRLTEVENHANRCKRYFAYAFDRINEHEPHNPGDHYMDRLGRAMIAVQYRMHPAIRRIVSQLFYESGGRQTAIQDPYSDDGDRHREWLATKEHGLGGDFEGIRVAWVNVRGSARRVPRRTTSFNDAEADWIVARCLPSLRTALETRGSLASTKVVILSGYRGQVNLLGQGISSLRRGDRFQRAVEELRRQGLRVSAETVDSFQGQEADIVIVSLVATGRFHFYRDVEPSNAEERKKAWIFRSERATEAKNRLNVMLSRAKQLLIVVGDLENMKATSTPLRDMLAIMESDSEEEYAVFNADDSIEFL